MVHNLHFKHSLVLAVLAICMILPGKGWTQIAAWDFAGVGSTSLPTYAATTFDANLVSTSGANTVTRGATAAWSAGGNSFRTIGFKNEGVATTNTDYFQITLIAATGYTVSLSTIDARFAGTGTFCVSPGVVTQFAYSLDGSNFTLIGTAQSLIGTPVTLAQINLSGITALQNVAAGTTITLRYYASGRTATGGWGFNSAATLGTNGLAIGGAVNAVSSGGPTQLAITSINGGTSPSVGTPYNVVVQSQDASNVPANVVATTNFTLSLATGTGTLGGTLTGSIAAGTNIATVTGVTYNAAETGVSITATRTSGDVLTAGTSSTFTVLSAADHLAFVNFPTIGFPAQIIPTFTVEARRADNTVDLNFPIASVTIAQASGPGTVTGTLIKPTTLGVATFNDIIMSANGNYTMSASCPGLTGATSGTITIIDPIYRSKASGNWNASSSWDVYDGTTWVAATDYPNAPNKVVTILNTHVISVTDNNGKCSDLTIDAGGKLWKNSTTSASYLYVYGNILNNGTIGSSDGGVTPSALGFDIEGANCLISGSGTFDAWRMAKFTTTNATTNLTIGQDVTLRYNVATAYTLYNSAAATTLNIVINQGKKLAVTIGKIDMTNINLTISSGASLLNNAAIDNQTGTNITVERSIAGGNWHLISSPVAGATAAMFTGKYLQTHQEALNTYTDIFDINEALTPMKGFALWGDATGFTAQYIGSLNTGAQSYSTAYSGAGKGWNLVGNPYASSIDWNASSGWTKTNVNGSIYLHVDNSTWATWNGSIGTDGGTQYIAPCQGFFVEANAAGALGMDNGVRVHNNTSFFKTSQEAVNNMIRLQASGNGYTNEAVVWFLPEATAEFDGNYDAHKLFGDVAEAAQLYSLGSTPLAINVLPETNTVPMGMKVGAAGVYTIAATELNDIASVSLEDTKTGTFTDLMNGSYSFNYTPGENEQRFVLHFNSLSVDEMENSFANVYGNANTVYVDLKNNVKGNIFVYTVAGQLVASVPAAQGSNKINLENTGNYIVKVISDKSTMVKKVFIQ